MRLLTFMLMSLLLATPALAWDEPDSFRGVPWGASLLELQTVLQRAGEDVDCKRYVPPFGGFCMGFGVKIGPAVVNNMYLFSKDGKFESVRMSFQVVHYPSLRAIFEERYGPPTTTRQEEIQNRMGAKFTNEISTWTGERVVISLRRYGSKVTEGRAQISLKSALERDREESEKAIKKGKEDL